MECSCNVSCYYDEEETYWGERQRRAAKEHLCYECRGKIAKGEYYWFHSVFGEGYIDNYKVCATCESLIHTFFSDGWIFGSTRKALREYLSESWSEDLPSDCISQLLPVARDVVCDYLQQYQVD